MEIIELRQILDFMRLDGHSYLQSAFLFMIWWAARGIRKDLSSFKLETDTSLKAHAKKSKDFEDRIYQLEQLKTKGY